MKESVYVVASISLLKNISNQGVALLPLYPFILVDVFWRFHCGDVEKGLVSRGWKTWHAVPVS